MSMFLADYHVHSRWSPDARYSMAEMAEAAARAGMAEVCFTDHVELTASGSRRRNVFDFSSLLREYADALSRTAGRIEVRLGVELAEIPQDPDYAETLFPRLPPLDFIIGSQHQLSDRFGREDLYYCAAHDEAAARAQIRDYLEQVLALARWGKFSVLGHLTLPLRYLNENNGLHMTFDGLEAEVEEIFRALIGNGCGIEVNTNRGGAPLPDEKWLRLYRRCGGEIVTLGSDAHSPDYVGCRIREGQALLRDCGFTRFAAFRRMEPVFHTL